DHAVAGLVAQRDVGPRAARPDLRPAYLGRPAADRTRPALLRRCADADRRSDRERPPLDRSPGGGHRQRQVAGNRADRSFAEFVRLEPERALAVLVAEDGQVENRVLNVPAGVPMSAFVEAGNFLNARIRGKTLAELRSEIEAAQ